MAFARGTVGLRAQVTPEGVELAWRQTPKYTFFGLQRRPSPGSGIPWQWVDGRRYMGTSVTTLDATVKPGAWEYRVIGRTTRNGPDVLRGEVVTVDVPAVQSGPPAQPQQQEAQITPPVHVVPPAPGPEDMKGVPAPGIDAPAPAAATGGASMTAEPALGPWQWAGIVALFALGLWAVIKGAD